MEKNKDEEKPLTLLEMETLLKGTKYIRFGSIRMCTELILDMFTRDYIKRLASSMGKELSLSKCTYDNIYQVWLRYIMTHSLINKRGKTNEQKDQKN